jgi:hypothetical protein
MAEYIGWLNKESSKMVGNKRNQAYWLNQRLNNRELEGRLQSMVGSIKGHKWVMVINRLSTGIGLNCRDQYLIVIANKQGSPLGQRW